MPLLLLIRHGENDFVKTGRLPGQSVRDPPQRAGPETGPGVGRSAEGRPDQGHLLESTGEGDGDCRANCPSTQPADHPRTGLEDANVGKWQGKSLKALRLTNAWKIVQHSPSRFQFPDGESFPGVQTRITNALERIARSHNKPKDIIAVVFHADPIKMAVAHFLGLPLDHFQRLSCDTGSLTALYVGDMGANLIKLNQRPPFDFLPGKANGKA